jgi:hypothetical protein
MAELRVSWDTGREMMQGFIASSAGGVLEFYSGSRPSTVHSAPTGDLLCAILLPEPAFEFVGNSSLINLVDPVSAAVTTSGTVGWFRIIGDTGSYDDQYRVDGEVSLPEGGGNIYFPSLEWDDTQLVMVSVLEMNIAT